MPEEIGKIGLDITDFQDGLADLAVLIPEVEQELKQLNAQLALMETQGKRGGKEYKILSDRIKEQGIYLAETKKQFSAFNAVIGDEAPKKTKTFVQSLSTLRSNIGLIFSGVALGGLAAGIKSLLDFGKQIKDTSLIADVLPSKLQGIQAAFADKLSIDDTNAALKILNQTMKGALTDTTGELQSKLSQLGISFEDIKDKSPDEVLLKIADYVKAAVDPVEALRVVTNLFGDELGAKLIPKLKEGGDAIDKFAKESAKASDGQIDVLNKWSKSWDSFGNSVKRNVLSAMGWIDEFTSRAGRDIGRANASKILINGKEVPLSEMPKGKPRGNPTVVGVPSEMPKGGTEATIPAAKEKGGLDYKTEAMREQQGLAYASIADYQKEKELLESQAREIDGMLKLLEGQENLEVESLRTQKAKNFELQYAWELTKKLRDSQIELDNAKAAKGRGFDEEQKVRLKEIQNISKQIRVADEQGQDDKVAALRAEHRDALLAYKEAKEAHADELMALRAQTTEMDAQQKGLLNIASQAAATATHQQAILAALRSQNTEAAALLIKQQAIANQASLAAQNRISPKDRIAARTAAREERRDAAKQIRREDAAQAAFDRGARPGVGSPMSQLIESRKIRKQAEKEQLGAALDGSFGFEFNRPSDGIKVNSPKDKAAEARMNQARAQSAKSSNPIDRIATALDSIKNEIIGN